MLLDIAITFPGVSEPDVGCVDSGEVLDVGRENAGFLFQSGKARSAQLDECGGRETVGGKMGPTCYGRQRCQASSRSVTFHAQRRSLHRPIVSQYLIEAPGSYNWNPIRQRKRNAISRTIIGCMAMVGGLTIMSFLYHPPHRRLRSFVRAIHHD